MTKQITNSNDGYTEALERIKDCAANRQSSLDLSRLHLAKLPPEIGELTTLRSLAFSFNSISSIPPEIGYLTKLEYLYFQDTLVSELPREFLHLTSLSTLCFCSINITSLPLVVCELTNLASLGIQFNRLTHLPPEIGQLTKLLELNLNHNALSELPTEIARLTSLVSLDLIDNKFKTLPAHISHLASLLSLDLSRNQVTSLPTDFGQLTKLNTLDLSENQLTVVPAEICQLPSLSVLDLSNNRLATLPTEIGQLKHLTKFAARENYLHTLPESLRNLTRLDALLLHGNNSLRLPKELLGPEHKNLKNRETSAWAKPREILDYYFARREQGDSPMQEVRVLLVGRGRVGKTSLLNVLQGRVPNLHEPETPGITVESVPLNCARGLAKAHVWDFGGQEFLHGTHQIFLSERCVYVLVLEGREGNWETETDYWLRFIQSFGGNSPVIVALNKYDAHSFSIDRHRLKERCPQIAGFIQTDAVTGKGISELRNLLESTVDQMDDVWVGVPLKWHRIKTALQEMSASFLEYRDYVVLCEKFGVADEGQQDSLAGALHRLGIALNFRDHHRLRHTSVLKPEWVTEAIYGLIRFTQKQDCHGVLREEWLPKALQPQTNYPTDKHGFVVDLMSKFEVAFPLDDKGTSWLIPELLGEEQPAAFEQFLGEKVQRLRFSYPDALPPGLLPRFIVRTHEMSEAHPEWRWRSGVVLQWAGCQALVRLDRLERRTEVAVLESPLPNQQSLFDIIRAHLVVLHGKVRAIEETEIAGRRGAWIKVPKLRLKEQQGTKQIQEFVDDEKEAVVEVSETLDQVESDAATEAAGPDPKRRVHLFISYAHVNEKELLPVRQHLTLLSQQGYIQVWQDRNLVAGEKWETGIVEELRRAEIVLLFYTTAARVSAFIQETELLISLDRSEKGDCTLIWVPLERNDLLDTHPLEKRLKAIQCATSDAKKIYEFEPHQVGWMQVEESIRRAVEKRRQLRSRK